MRVKNYFYKLSLFSFNEKLIILLFSMATLIFEKINKNIVNTYLLYADLKRKDIEINKENGCNVFLYPINDKNFKIPIKRNSSDALVFRQLILEEEYLDLIKIFQTNNIYPKTMIDGGANIGFASIYFKAFFPDLQIIALEPVSSTFGRLVKNLKANNIKNVECIEKGLWRENTFLKLDKTNRDKSDWAFRLVESQVADENTIETTNIKSILEEKRWESIDFLKLDIEGGEASVFHDHESVKDWLPKVKVFAIEIHDEFNCRENIFQLLKDYNFEHWESSSLTIGINKALIKA
jgi:FkbM family methyltransferase